MTLERRIGNYRVTADCLNRLQPQAEALLAKLAELDARGPRLRGGSVIDFGWSRLQLIEEEPGRLRLSEPEFLGDPTRRWSPFIDVSLDIARAQAEWVLRLNTTALDLRWDHFVTMAHGVAQHPRIFLRRLKPKNASDTGWFIDNAEKGAPPARQTERIAAWQLYPAHSEWLEVMALPVDWIVVFNRGAIEAILNPAGEIVWTLLSSSPA